MEEGVVVLAKNSEFPFQECFLHSIISTHYYSIHNAFDQLTFADFILNKGACIKQTSCGATPQLTAQAPQIC